MSAKFEAEDEAGVGAVVGAGTGAALEVGVEIEVGAESEAECPETVDGMESEDEAGTVPEADAEMDSASQAGLEAGLQVEAESEAECPETVDGMESEDEAGTVPETDAEMDSASQAGLEAGLKVEAESEAECPETVTGMESEDEAGLKLPGAAEWEREWARSRSRASTCSPSVVSGWMCSSSCVRMFVPPATIIELPMSNMAAGTNAASPSTACTTGKQKQPMFSPAALSIKNVRRLTGVCRVDTKITMIGMNATTNPTAASHNSDKSCGCVANE
ncbi:hypothetical protein BIFGAL_03451 [Bifidobacterium gallicum DSM 20093 = LMG 11596]|uniref:Uncharacterized protein n=1 Tax=Bifidobacterium gallicum DSM 20093 = LMG 11596 TaxID=561180 RepID=D1NUC8_9BIFI|nr:hypothetical protein BIFGAL_03451 [Bifidobacterium gallicum DSM 20093 = LMG 11596]